jgi:hypothetical protein
VYWEYETSGIDAGDFTEALSASLKRGRFEIAKRDRSIVKGIEELTYELSFRGFTIMTLKLRQKRAVRPAVKKAFPHPNVAIVIDDFGYTMDNLETFFAIGAPIAFSVLPNLKYSSIIAKEARSQGYEVILHLPLEPHRKDVREEVDTINSKLSKAEITARLERALRSVPGAVGVSNHMGSKSTEEPQLMETIFFALKEDEIFFLDSLVTNKSVCEGVARKVGIRYAKRSVFLDNALDEARIETQINRLRDRAFATGSAIAIGHDRKVTAKVLGEALPELQREGMRFVKVSELAS